MNKTQEQLEKLRKVAESSLNKTEELQKVLAKIEALMSKTELQKVSEKKKDQYKFYFFIFNKTFLTKTLKMWKTLWKKYKKRICFFGLTDKRLILLKIFKNIFFIKIENYFN